MIKFGYFLLGIVVSLIWRSLIASSRKKDPIYSCIIYKRSGCSHVDGAECNYNKCKERLEAEMFDLEVKLDIPHKDRYYNRKINDGTK